MTLRNCGSRGSRKYLPQVTHGMTSSRQAVERFVERGELSPRQREVVLAVIDGMQDKEIGVMLGISRSTVRKMFDRIGQKTGARTRAQIVGRVIAELCEGDLHPSPEGPRKPPVQPGRSA
jgi:DNA-binding NarL/FixJ family response regulator